MYKERIRLFVFIVAVVSLLTGCVFSAHGPHGHASVITAPPPKVKSGPPPHARAYGHRGKHHYHYYPDAYIYFDTGRQVYFYLENGSWAMSVSLPTHLHINLDSRVSIEMDVDRPYVRYEEHRKKYPGKKHKRKQKGKYKKKKKYDD